MFFYIHTEIVQILEEILKTYSTLHLISKLIFPHNFTIQKTKDQRIRL